MVSTLISSTWLRQQLSNGLKSIRLLDASWHMDSSRSAKDEYLAERIDGAMFFDIDDVADKKSPYDHMLPPAQQFAEQVGKLGVSNSNHVIIYDNNEQYGLFSSPRVWWMFKVFGHSNVSVLDGGLPSWKRHNLPLDHGPPPTPIPQQYSAHYNKQLVRNISQMQDYLATGNTQVVDARSKGRFDGTDPEPCANYPSGHMIGAKSLPFKNLLDPETKLLKNTDHLEEEFKAAGIDLSSATVATCGSGVTAAIISLAAHMIKHDIILPIYDGSWTEWVQAAPAHTRNEGILDG